MNKIIAIVILIIFSAYFSATETAFTSVNRIKLKSLASEGDHRAEKVLRLSDMYDKLLTTILVGNNVVNICMTAIATALFIELYGKNGAAIATAVITVVVLIFGEITPKNIAKEKSEGFAKFAAPLISVLMVILTPVNFIFTQWKRLIAKIFNINNDATITDDELLTMVEEAENVGGLDQNRSLLIQNAIEFDELTSEDVMTPRPEMIAVEIDCDVEELGKIFLETGYSRVPVYEDEIDKIVGVIHQKEYHNYIVTGKKSLVEMISPVVFVAESMKIFDLLKKMQSLKTHIAIVIDEYGGTAGLVTMEDIIEELVGEIYDEHDAVATKEMMPLQNGSYRVRCDANIAKIFDYFGIEGDITEFNTVNGWVAMELDKLPSRNDKFETIIDGRKLTVRVTKADDRKAIEINLVVEALEHNDEILETNK